MLWRNKRITVPAFEALAQSHDYGRAWYRDSGQSIADYAASLGVSPGYVADVVAILSPRVSVAHNVRLARSYLETGKAPGAMRSRLNALARYESSGLFNGPKVNAFSAALQGDPDAVVVDAWMFRLLDEPGRGLPAYRRCAARIGDIAASLGWPPAETQAALWVGARSLVGYRDDYSPLILGSGGRC